MTIFEVNVGQPVFIEAKDDGGGGDHWSYKLCKAMSLQKLYNSIILSNCMDGESISRTLFYEIQRLRRT